jgi:hypothetical protein
MRGTDFWDMLGCTGGSDTSRTELFDEGSLPLVFSLGLLLMAVRDEEEGVVLCFPPSQMTGELVMILEI